MEKRKNDYIEPYTEIVLFASHDLITTSGDEYGWSDGNMDSGGWDEN